MPVVGDITRKIGPLYYNSVCYLELEKDNIFFGQNLGFPTTVERFSVRNSFFFRSLFLLSTCADTAAAVVVWL